MLGQHFTMKVSEEEGKRESERKGERERIWRWTSKVYEERVIKIKRS